MYTCPVCNFAGLEKAPWYQKTLANGSLAWRTSHEICPSCGIEFGRDDWASGNPQQRELAWATWRKHWQKKGKNMHLDHLVIVVPTLELGAAWFLEQTGIMPHAGGKHALMGTHNLLVRLGGESYIELIAIDPDAPAPNRPRWFELDTAPQAPALVHWVARMQNLEDVRPLEPLGVVTDVTRGAYTWKITIPDDGKFVLGGLVPTLIQWQSQHPTAKLPESGLRLLALEGIHPEPARVQQNLEPLGLELTVQHGAAVRLKALLETPNGKVWL